MTINTNLLVSAPVLQDYLANKDGTPLSDGFIFLYKDNSRTTLKNWYTLSGTAGNYSFIPLPNPLTLSGAGTIQDDNGNDVIPFFYPFSETNEQLPEPYFIQVYNSGMQLQFTRQNFPYLPINNFDNTVSTLVNYITNNVFWRNIGSVNATSFTNLIIAPGNHDGFTDSDIRFIKDATGAVDTITFNKFPIGNLPNQFLPDDITPEFYLNVNCTQAGSETVKYVQFPISLHLKSLESQKAVIKLWAQNVAGNVNNRITVSIYQFCGTNSPDSSVSLEQTITLTDNWTPYTIDFDFPNAAGLNISSTGDDAYYLQIGYPATMTCNINIAKPSLYLGSDLPTNDIDTYDQVDRIISSPRTGDTRTSLNAFQPYGWVFMNDGVIGNSSIAPPLGGIPFARNNNDTWQLFNLIYNSTTNTQCQLYDNAGNPIARVPSPYTAFTSNYSIRLPLQLNRAFASQGPGNLLGSAAGASTVALTINNMPAHHHAGSQAAVTATTVAGPPNNQILTANGPALSEINYAASLSIVSEGSSTPFSIIPPTTYYYTYIKL